MFIEGGNINRLSLADRARILGCLVEGNSLRSTTRITGRSINTVTNLLVDVGTACDLYQNEKLRKLKCKPIQCDEIWAFCGAKERNLPREQRGQYGRGDVYTWTGLCADTKLMVSWLVGKRSPKYANAFMLDVASRLADRVQLTTDGHRAYLNAVEAAFGSNIDYAMLVKLYGEVGASDTAERKYSLAECCGIVKGTVSGFPDDAHVST